MDMYDSALSPGHLLNEQVARHIFENLTCDGPVMIIIDDQNHCWPSDSEKFSKLNLTEDFLRQICARINDGVEPVIAKTDNCDIFAAQLATEKTNCGYVILALPGTKSDTTPANCDLADMLLNQVNLIAKLIEKNHLLYELQIKQFSRYAQSEAAAN